jgi:small-conductance mechanosensitive channel
LFTGYGDSSINFELRVWPSQFNQAVQVRSDLATAVFDAVNAAEGMSFPFPQREVRILSDHDTGSIMAPVNAVKKE